MHFPLQHPTLNSASLSHSPSCADYAISHVHHLVLAGLVQYVQRLHGHCLAVVVKLRHQQLHAPATEKLDARTQQHAEVFGGIQPTGLYCGKEGTSLL